MRSDAHFIPFQYSVGPQRWALAVEMDVDEMNHLTDEMANASGYVKLSAEALSKLAGQLKALVVRF